MSNTAKKCLAGFVLFGILTSASTVSATPVTYTSRTAFLAALATASTQTYETIAPDLRGSEVSTDYDPYTFTLGDVTAISGGSINADYDYTRSNTQISTGFQRPDAAADRKLTFSIGFAVNGIGIDLIDYQSPDTAGTDPIILTAFGISTTLNGSPTAANPTFFGIIDTAALTDSLVITSLAQIDYPLTFDNVSYGRVAQAAAVPEPASAVALGTAIFLLNRVRRRRG